MVVLSVRNWLPNLGVSFYDKALIKGLCEKYHLTVDEVERLKVPEEQLVVRLQACRLYR